MPTDLKHEEKKIAYRYIDKNHFLIGSLSIEKFPAVRSVSNKYECVLTVKKMCFPIACEGNVVLAVFGWWLGSSRLWALALLLDGVG